MAISSCLKFQLNNESPRINSFNKNNYEFVIDAVAGSSIDDFIVFSHLGIFFSGQTEWHYVTPPIMTTGTGAIPLIGNIADSELLINHPADSLSLACFTKQSIKDAVAYDVPQFDMNDVMPAAEWRALINQTDFKDLNAVITANSPHGVNITVIPARTTLKIMRCTQSDIDALPISLGDYPAYVDAFDVVKARLVNNVALLNNTGHTPAVYHADGDYIEFIADCAIKYTISDPVLLPPLN